MTPTVGSPAASSIRWGHHLQAHTQRQSVVQTTDNRIDRQIAAGLGYRKISGINHLWPLLSVAAMAACTISPFFAELALFQVRVTVVDSEARRH